MLHSLLMVERIKINIQQNDIMITAEILKHKDVYTISIPDKKGGPIISHEDIDEAKRLFMDALHLCMAIRNLLHYEKHKCFYDLSPIKEIVYGNIKYV